MSEFRLLERNACPICGSPEYRKILTHYDDRFGQPDLFDVVECVDPLCRLAFLKQTVAPEDISNLYAKYYHHYDVPPKLPIAIEYTKHFAKTVRNFLFNTDDLYHNIMPHQKVLNVGCGYGPSTFFLRYKMVTWTGLELDPVKVEFNRLKGLVCEMQTLEEFSSNCSEKFDTILVNQVLEHVSQPLAFLNALRNLLSQTGTAFFSTPNFGSKYRHSYGRNWIHWHIPYHQLYFNVTSLQRLAQETGLKVKEVYTRTPFSFFVIQRNMRACTRGKPNPWFRERKSLRDLLFFLDLRNFTCKTNTAEDCLYASVTLPS